MFTAEPFTKGLNILGDESMIDIIDRVHKAFPPLNITFDDEICNSITFIYERINIEFSFWAGLNETTTIITNAYSTPSGDFKLSSTEYKTTEEDFINNCKFYNEYLLSGKRAKGLMSDEKTAKMIYDIATEYKRDHLYNW